MSLNMFNKIHELSQTTPMEFNTIDGYRTPLPWKRNGTIIERTFNQLGLWTNQVVFIQGSFNENTGPFFVDWPFNVDIFRVKNVQYKAKFKREVYKDHYHWYHPAGQNTLSAPLFVDTLEAIFWPDANRYDWDPSLGADSSAYDASFHFFAGAYYNTGADRNNQGLSKNYFRWKRNMVPTTNSNQVRYVTDDSPWMLDNDTHNKVIPGFPYHGVNTNIIVLETQLGSKFHIRQWHSNHTLRVRGQPYSPNNNNTMNNTYSEGGIIEFSSYSTINGAFNIDPVSYTGRILKWTDPEFKLEAGKHFRIILDYSYPRLLQVTGVSA